LQIDQLVLLSAPVPEGPWKFSIEEQLLRTHVKRFRGGLVSKARILLYHATLGSRVMKKIDKKVREENIRTRFQSTDRWSRIGFSQQMIASHPLLHAGVAVQARRLLVQKRARNQRLASPRSTESELHGYLAHKKPHPHPRALGTVLL